MKYLILLSVLFLSFCKPRIPKEYRKMQKKVERRENRKAKEERMNSLDLDTVYYKWTPITDTVLLGTPKIPK
jgi:hypothetical protein